MIDNQPNRYVLTAQASKSRRRINYTVLFLAVCAVLTVLELIF